MRIAIPMVEDRLCRHFGHCQEFALIEVDPQARLVLKEDRLPAPPHQPGLLPGWLAEQGAQVVIAGGMGGRALDLFNAAGIQVVTGAPGGSSRDIALAWLHGSLETGENTCDH